MTFPAQLYSILRRETRSPFLQQLVRLLICPSRHSTFCFYLTSLNKNNLVTAALFEARSRPGNSGLCISRISIWYVVLERGKTDIICTRKLSGKTQPPSSVIVTRYWVRAARQSRGNSRTSRKQTPCCSDLKRDFHHKNVFKKHFRLLRQM